MDSIASAAIKYGSRRTRELLFQPYDMRFILRAWLPVASSDPRWRELQRLKPYYQGTRGLAWLAVLLSIPPFVMPFFAPLIGFTGIIYLLIGYIAVFIAVNVIGLFVEVSVDAIMALRHERHISLTKATRAFLDFSLASPGQSLRYMGAKLIVDTLLLSATILLYMPALFALIWVLSYLVRALTAGAPDVALWTALGFFAVFILGLAAVFISMIISVPSSAFYGYYTEEAIKHMLTFCQADEAHEG